MTITSPCCNATAHRHGKTKAGSQRYKCSACTFVFTDSDKPQGGQPIGDQPMTRTELNRRWLAKKKQNNNN